MTRRLRQRVFTRFEVRRTGVGLFEAMDSWPWRDWQGTTRAIRRQDRQEFEALVNWLYLHTDGPPKKAYRRRRGLSRPRTWWTPNATEHIDTAWRICLIMNRHGVALAPMQSVRAPGRVVYRDACQAVICADPRRVRLMIKKRPRRKGTGWNGDRTTIRRWPTPLDVRIVSVPPLGSEYASAQGDTNER